MIDGPKTASTLFGESVLSRYTTNKSSRAHERGELYRSFMSRVNPSRQLLGFKPLTESRLGRVTQKMKTDELTQFYFRCLEAKDFVGCFNGKFFAKTK